MKKLRRVFLKLSRLFTNSREEAELAREIAAHLALLEDDYLRQGMAPEEARQAARRAYGGIEQAKQMHRNDAPIKGWRRPCNTLATPSANCVSRQGSPSRPS